MVVVHILSRGASSSLRFKRLMSGCSNSCVHISVGRGYLHTRKGPLYSFLPHDLVMNLCSTPCHLPTFLTTLNILGVEEDVRPGGRDIILSGLGRCHELILEVALSLSRPFKKFHPSIRSYYVPSESCLLFLLLTNHQRSSRNPTRATTLCLHNIYSISSYHSFSVCQCTVLYLFMMSLLFFPFPIAFHCSFTRYVILHRHSIIIPPS